MIPYQKEHGKSLEEIDKGRKGGDVPIPTILELTWMQSAPIPESQILYTITFILALTTLLLLLLLLKDELSSQQN